MGDGVHMDPKRSDRELLPTVCHTTLWVARSTVDREGSRRAVPLTQARLVRVSEGSGTFCSFRLHGHTQLRRGPRARRKAETRASACGADAGHRPAAQGRPVH